MKKIPLGNSGIEISVMGLGCMYFGSKVDDHSSGRLIDLYLEQGGNFLDSANKYASWLPGCAGGESERLIGKWLRQSGTRKKVLLSSKVGFAYGRVPRSLDRNIIISECEQSLKHMGVDCIDLYFAHSFDADTPAEESMEAFYQLKKSGKIRIAGASNYPAWRLEQANVAAEEQGWEGFRCLQQRHSYLEPSLRSDFGNQVVLSPETADYCREQELGIMAYSPLLGGIYGKPEAELPPRYRSLDTEQKLETLHLLSREKEVSPNQLVLAWMLHSDPRIMPVISGSSEAQILENLDSVNISLSQDEMDKLNKPVVIPEKYD